MNTTFETFLKSVKTENNKHLVESIESAYTTIYEGSGLIRGGLLGAGIMGSTLALGNHLVTKNDEALSNRMDKEIPALIQSTEKGDLVSKKTLNNEYNVVRGYNSELNLKYYYDVNNPYIMWDVNGQKIDQGDVM